MKLGINQLALLRRCLLKGTIGIYDVSVYYHMKNGRKRLGILEKLELQGYLENVGVRRWILTEKGRQVLNKQLSNMKRQRNESNSK